MSERTDSGLALRQAQGEALMLSLSKYEGHSAMSPFIGSLVLAHWETIDLTENHIKQLHRDLPRHSTADERHRGEYKSLPNHIEAFGADGESVGVVFETASPFDTPRLMSALVSWTRVSEGHIHPLLIIAIFVAVFLEIHPFQDGNGRLSRILTTLLMLRAGYAYVPYGSLENEIEQSKEAYYRALRQTQGTIRTEAPDWQPWVMYFLEALQHQKKRLEKRAETERFFLANLPELSVQILELAREHSRVTVGEAVTATGASRNTIKDHVKALRIRGTWSSTEQGEGRGIRRYDIRWSMCEMDCRDKAKNSNDMNSHRKAIADVG